MHPEKKGAEKVKNEDGISQLNVPNNDLSHRCTNYRLKGLFRVYHFHNAPIIKFVNHFVRIFEFFLIP